MKSLIVKKTSGKGKGVFANRDFKKGEKIMHNDMSKLKKLTLKEISKFPKEKRIHSDYAGKGKYVIDMSTFSYVNHSCDANVEVKMKSILIKDAYALRKIKKGEEITIDYSLSALDHFDRGSYRWVMKCKCGAKNCRKKVTGNFFDLPKTIQKRFYKNLPPSIKKRYKKKFKELR